MLIPACRPGAINGRQPETCIKMAHGGYVACPEDKLMSSDYPFHLVAARKAQRTRKVRLCLMP